MATYTQRCKFCHELAKWEEPNTCKCDCIGMKCLEFIKELNDARELNGFESMRLHRIGLMANSLLKQIGELE